MRAIKQKRLMNTVRYGSAAASLAMATMLSLPGCFGGKDSKVTQNPGEATMDSGAGSSVVDLGQSGATQQVGYTANPNGSPGEVHAHFLSADGKEYVDQINYARLKQNLPDRPGASVSSVTFDQFLKTDYNQLGKAPASQSPTNAAPAAWANQNVARTTPPATPGVSNVSLAGAQAPASQATPWPTQPAATASVALDAQTPADPWAAVTQPQPPAIPQKPTTVATVAMATPGTTETAKPGTPLKPNSPLAAKYQATRKIPKPEEKPPFFGATVVTQEPAAAKPASNPSTFLATRIRIDLEEAKIKLADGHLADAQQNIQSAKETAMKMQQIDPTIIREIALASMEVERRLTPPQQIVKETAIIQTASLPNVRDAFPQKTPQISDYELSNNPSIAKLTGGSTVKITPRTAFIDLSRDSVNQVNSPSAPIDQFTSFEKSISKANQPISLSSAGQGGASTSTMLPANFWHAEPVQQSSPIQQAAPTLPPAIVDSIPPSTSNFSKSPMQVPAAAELALAESTHTGSPLAHALPPLALTAPNVAQIAFEDGQETPSLATAAHADLTQVPAPEKGSTLEAKDSRLEIPGWVTYGVIISALGLLTLAFRRM